MIKNTEKSFFIHFYFLVFHRIFVSHYHREDFVFANRADKPYQQLFYYNAAGCADCILPDL